MARIATLTRRPAPVRSVAGPQRRWDYTLHFPEPDEHGFRSSTGTKEQMAALAKRRGWTIREES
jgi:hypothetical protein